MQILIDLPNPDLSLFSALTEKHIGLGIARANRRTSQWLSTQVARNVSHALGLPVSTYKKRRVKVRSAGEWGVTVWAGANPVAAYRFGTVTWNRRMTGAKAGRRTFTGTFARQRGGQRVIFRRVSAARLPLQKELVEIDEVVSGVVNSLVATTSSRYQQRVLHELRFLLEKQA